MGCVTFQSHCITEISNLRCKNPVSTANWNGIDKTAPDLSTENVGLRNNKLRLFTFQTLHI